MGGGRISLLLVLVRSRRLLLRTGLRDRTSHPKRGGTSGLLASQHRGRVSSATSLDTIDRIALRDRDPSVMGHRSPNHQWDFPKHSLFLHPRYGSKEPVSVAERCTSTFGSADKPEGPEYGSRSGTGLTGHDFRDPGVCLRRCIRG